MSGCSRRFVPPSPRAGPEGIGWWARPVGRGPGKGACLRRWAHASDEGVFVLLHLFPVIGRQGFKTLAEKQRVQFEVTQGRKGLQASRIQVI